MANIERPTKKNVFPLHRFIERNYKERGKGIRRSVGHYLNVVDAFGLHRPGIDCKFISLPAFHILIHGRLLDLPRRLEKKGFGLVEPASDTEFRSFAFPSKILPDFMPDASVLDFSIDSRDRHPCMMKVPSRVEGIIAKILLHEKYEGNRIEDLMDIAEQFGDHFVNLPWLSGKTLLDIPKFANMLKENNFIPLCMETKFHVM